MKKYRRTSLALLVAIDGALLNDGDQCSLVQLVNGVYEKSEYYLSAYSNETEDSPRILAPTTNPGSKRWHLMAMSSL